MHSHDRRTALLAATIALTALLGLAAPVRAAELEGARFEDRVELEGTSLSLHGLALLRYRTIFRAYVAGLYLSEADDAMRVLDDVPKRLELSYFWGIAGEDFGMAANTLLERALPTRELAALRPRIDALHALYRDVEPGDRYALTYVPGLGTQLSLNGRSLGSVPGADFASAYFGIWLGPLPLDPGLRDALLRGRGRPGG